MPTPVALDTTPAPATDEEIARAEAYLAEFIRIVRNGTTGATVNTPPSTIPDPKNPGALVPVEIKTAEQQLFFRQTAISLVRTLTAFADATTIGTTRLSSDPSDPALPTALNSEEVSTTPGPNKVPRAAATGLLDPGWIGGTSGAVSVPTTFLATCDPVISTGDIVYVSGVNLKVSRVDIANQTKIPAIGMVISKPSATSALVQTAGHVTNVYLSLVPNAAYFVSSTGRLTNVRPTGSEANPVFVIHLGYALDAKTFLFRPTTVVRTLS